MKKLIKNKKIILCLILLGNFLIFTNVLAQWKLETPWPKTPTGKDLTPSSTITELVQYFYEWGIALGGLAAFIALVIAGFLYLTSAGDVARMREAKERIYWALGGLVLLLASWLILNAINPELTTLKEPAFDYIKLLALGDCDTDNDCRQIQFTYPKTNQTTTQIIGGENCYCQGDPKKNGIKEGTCVCRGEKIVSCDYVSIYENEGYDGHLGDLQGTGQKGGCVNAGEPPFTSSSTTIPVGSSQGKMNEPDKRTDGKSYLYVLSGSEKRRVENIELDNCLEAQTNEKIREEIEELAKQGNLVICEPFNCTGRLQLFKDRNCENMMTEKGATNPTISEEVKVASVKFVTTPSESASQ